MVHSLTTADLVTMPAEKVRFTQNPYNLQKFKNMEVNINILSNSFNFSLKLILSGIFTMFIHS